MFAQKSLSGAQGNLATAVQRLSSGLRINSAKDDAAGLSVAQNMQSQINAINMAARNINDATNMLTTADSSLGTIQDILLRMKTLVVEGKNDSLSGAQRKNISTELSQLNDEIVSISTKTTFNGNNLLRTGGNITATGLLPGLSAGPSSTVSAVTYSNTNTGLYTLAGAGTTLTMTSGSVSQALVMTNTVANTARDLDFSTFGVKISLVSGGVSTAAELATALNAKVTNVTNGVSTLNFQAGSANTDLFAFNTLDTRTTGGSVATYSNVNAAQATLTNLTNTSSSTDFNNAFNTYGDNIDAAINLMNTDRATLGAQMNRLSYVSSALMNQSTNMSQSRSAIIDTDFAAETANLTKGQIMQQAATAMLAQANQMPNVILSLLK
jgi:flagellin